MSLNFTNPVGFRFFSLMVMITVLLLSLSKSFVDQFKDFPSIYQFCLINILGFILFFVSLIYGKKVSNHRVQWFVNSFLSAGAVLVSYSSTVEVDEQIHSVYIPVFYLIELFIVLICANKVGVETTPTRYQELVRTSTT